MNYIIEDNIDFFAELNKLNINNQENNNIKNTENKDDTMCLLSHLPLTENHIILPCNHSFNYIELYNEIVAKRLKYNNYDNDKLQEHQTKCPYCRIVHNGLIPYIPMNGVKQLRKVNNPHEYIFEKYKTKCSYVLKSGSKKGEQCSLNGIKIKLADKNEYDLCPNHNKLMEKTLLNAIKIKENKQKKKEETKNNEEKKENEEIILTPEMENFAKTKTIEQLKKIIKSYNEHPNNHFYSKLTGSKKELVKRFFEIKNELIVLEIISK